MFHIEVHKEHKDRGHVGELEKEAERTTWMADAAGTRGPYYIAIPYP